MDGRLIYVYYTTDILDMILIEGTVSMGNVNDFLVCSNYVKENVGVLTKGRGLSSKGIDTLNSRLGIRRIIYSRSAYNTVIVHVLITDFVRFGDDFVRHRGVCIILPKIA